MCSKFTSLLKINIIRRRIRDDVVMFTYSGINWVSGIFSLMFTLQVNGVRVITNEPFSPKGFGQIVKKHKVTTTFTTTENDIATLNSPDFDPASFVSMKEYLSGGERIPTVVKEFLRSKLPPKCFGAAYGSTECGAMATYDPDSDTSGVEGSVVGIPRSFVHIKIVDTASRKALGVNEQGELLIKTQMIFNVSFSIRAYPQMTSAFRRWGREEGKKRRGRRGRSSRIYSKCDV